MKFTKITKRQARKLFADNSPIYVIAHKMRPGGPFHMGMTIFPQRYHEESRTFDQMINDFTYYNCSHETGYYPAYYQENN